MEPFHYVRYDRRKGVWDKMRRLLLVITILLMLILASCTKSEADEKIEILVAAASSMTPALTEIATEFEKVNKGIQVTFTFGSSGKLAQQIKNGAPVDVFISASSSDMDTLEVDKKIESDTRIDITSNTLVVIRQKNGDNSLLNEENPFTSKIDHFAIGNPDTVPAGVYAKEALTKLGEWETLEPKLVFGKDVRQVLTFVETGNAEMGIVFTSDAHSSNKVEVISEIDPKLHSSAVYPGALITATKQPKAASAFLDYMKTPEVQKILVDYGFTN
ncbi:molybdate ABC transporter substrate-binding protein [Sporosarcina sp. E16_3]|uniref:molybdate ABC transporter substrate-binding protein n=1 Tax=Sporosarcina sp. E16_3 TaxID=2789293 RepID=UPI001A91C15D|nr:molybdate ABC transporter substrate-binding protein [Sporosarcina sp. E16_3]MBO0601218.1 molybdate ABC transporter substrate-binding protein [Sporosarcina sp. E16_3]